MAKSARASGIKKNRQVLKKKVFGPVEAARNERLSSKLLELAQQPKTREVEMEEEGVSYSNSSTNVQDDHETDNATGIEAQTSDAKNDSKATKGASQSSFAISIPACLLHNSHDSHALPTPPATPTLDASTITTPILDIPAQKQLAQELFFFHMLGASTDIVGFDEHGDLLLDFAKS